MGNFVQVVTEAINQSSDNWESHYYHGTDEKPEFNPAKREVYLQTRFSALGPEAEDAVRWVWRMQGDLGFCDQPAQA